MEEKIDLLKKYESEGWTVFTNQGNFFVLTKGTLLLCFNRAFSVVLKGPCDLSKKPQVPCGSIGPFPVSHEATGI